MSSSSSSKTGSEVDAFRHLTDAEIREFREIFSLVDKDGGGTIDAEELLSLMTTLGITTTEKEVRDMLAEIDEDSNGEIDFGEFCYVMSRKVSATYTPDAVKKSFAVFEGTSPSGHIRISDLVKALSTYGADVLDEAEAEELVGQLDVDANGLFNYESFVEVMMSGSGTASGGAPLAGPGAGAGAGAGASPRTTGSAGGSGRASGSVVSLRGSARRVPDGRGAVAAVAQAKQEKIGIRGWRSGAAAGAGAGAGGVGGSVGDGGSGLGQGSAASTRLCAGSSMFR